MEEYAIAFETRDALISYARANEYIPTGPGQYQTRDGAYVLAVEDCQTCTIRGWHLHIS